MSDLDINQLPAASGANDADLLVKWDATQSSGQRTQKWMLRQLVDYIFAQGPGGVPLPLGITNGGTGSSTAAGGRSNLGLGSIATQSASSVSITGGVIDGVSIGGIAPATGRFTSVSTSTPISVSSGGLGTGTAGGGALDNVLGIAGQGGGGVLSRTGAGAYIFDASVQPRVYARNSVMEYMPAAVATAVLAGTNTADLSGYINTAIASAIGNLYFPKADYVINNPINGAANKALIGDGVNLSRFIVGTGFNMGSAAVFVGAPYGGLHGIGFVFDQSGASSRATLVQYPWAIDLTNAGRFQIGHVRIQAAYKGVNADQGNAGGNGFDAHLLEIAAFSIGAILNNIRDFAHIDVLNFWSWDFVANAALMAIYTDGQGIGARIGIADGLEIGRLTSFEQQVIIDAATTSDRYIGSMQLDTENAVLTMSGGPLEIGHFLSTKSSGTATKPSITVNGGILVIGPSRIVGNEAAPQILVQGGQLVLTGGYIEQDNPNFQALWVTNGSAVLNGVALLPNGNTTRTKPYLQQGGGGTLALHGCTASPLGSGSGVLVEMDVDNAGNDVSGNGFGGWAYKLPPTISAGIYGPNGAAPIPFTPTVTWQTVGDWAPNYAIQQGIAYLDGQGYKFEIRIAFTPNAYTSVQGAPEIAGLPFAKASGSVDQGVVPIGVSNVNFSSGYSLPGVAWVSGQKFGYLYQMGSGKAMTPMVPACLPQSTGINIMITGYIPVR